MAPQELILSACSSDPSSSSSRQQSTPSIHLHDLLTSGSVQSFKNSASSLNSLGYVQSQNGQGGGLFAVQEGKAILNVWAWQKDQMHTKIHLPEKMSCFSVSPNGLWAVAGSPNGQIYLWEIASGLLLSSFTAHYRSLTSLTFTPDSQILISTSLDSSTHIFLVSRLIDPEDPATAGKPYGSLTDHTLAVRGVGLGKMAGSMGGRIWTFSDDGTVKMWSLHPPFTLISTFTLPSGSSPNNISIDPMERFFYVSTIQGEVYYIPLFRRKNLNSNLTETNDSYESSINESSLISNKIEGSVISINEKEKDKKIKITSMTLSISSTNLILGFSNGQINLYSLPSHQHLRTLSSHSNSITHLSTLLKPLDLIKSNNSNGGAGGGGNNGNGKLLEEYSIFEIKSFERIKSQNVKLNHNITIKLSQNTNYNNTLSTNLLLNKLDELRPKSIKSIGSNGNTQNIEQNQLEALLEENKRLRTSLEKASKINEKMWNGIIDMKLDNGES
ncbi:uncharacterized protein I206_107182 [Kwoniella pini CBS 10737]|uniref:Pre-rRNA-processing protein IPI3 n=1 Tax=Kwoniella pini CBS 10737 TaxID=1296096 RepID=A0A1B9HYY0_9TREE|nr:uncharacterized protein I206_05272 [Kwoniella pini CBS 10737]OCF48493.1 hypothetical protein I206_05272 [Kwoniella pini CBS 10737]